MPTRVQLPYATNTTNLDLEDTDNLYRVRDIETQIQYLNQDDGTFYRILNMLPQGQAATQAIYYWVEDTMPDNYTRINAGAGYAAGITALVVDDSLLAIPNRMFVVQRTEEIVFVSSVVYSTHTLTVTRGYLGTTAAALVDNDILIALPAALPELADANTGTGLTPTGESSNYISRFSETFEVSHVQEMAEMIDGIGQVPWEVINKMLSVKRQINKSLIYGKKGKIDTGADGDLFSSDGFIHYVSTNVLDLEENNGILTWPILNDWLYGLFDYTASSQSKILICGNALFAGISRIWRDMTQDRPYFEPMLGANALQIVTDEGQGVDVVMDRHGFDGREGIGGDGIVVDASYVELKEYTGEPLAWRPNIENPDAHVRKDEIWGSYSLKLRHEELHGRIKGAVRAVSSNLA